MFKCGDLIVYGNNGVCCIEEIAPLESETANKDKLYYVLKNLTSNGVAYIPVDSNVYIRPIMSKSEAVALVEKIPTVTTEAFKTVPPRELQKVYRDVLNFHDNIKTLSLIKHLRLTAKKKQALKKKLSATEERFLEQALKIIGSELSAALEIPMDEAKNCILDHLNID